MNGPPHLIEEEEIWNPKFPKRNYDKQAKCQHTNFKLFFKCSCTLTCGEMDLDKIMPSLIKEWERQKASKIKVVELTI